MYLERETFEARRTREDSRRHESKSLPEKEEMIVVDQPVRAPSVRALHSNWPTRHDDHPGVARLIERQILEAVDGVVGAPIPVMKNRAREISVRPQHCDQNMGKTTSKSVKVACFGNARMSSGHRLFGTQLELTCDVTPGTSQGQFFRRLLPVQRKLQHEPRRGRETPPAEKPVQIVLIPGDLRAEALDAEGAEILDELV